MRTRLLWIGIGIFAVSCLSPLLGYILYQTQGRRVLQAELDKIADEPLTTTELAAYHAMPPGVQDNTDQWLHLLQSFEDRDYKEMEYFMPITGIGMKLPPLAESIPDEDRIAVDHFLAINRPKLATLYRLADESGEVRYPRDFQKFFSDLQSPVQLRNAHKLLQLEFQLVARQSDPSEAIQNFHARIALAETCKQELDAVLMLTRVAIIGVALSDARVLLAVSKLDEKQLALLQSHLDKVAFYPQLQLAMFDERGQRYKAFFHATGHVSDATQLVGPAETTRAVQEVARPHDCALTLELLNRACVCARLPLPQAIQQSELLADDIQKIKNDDRFIARRRYHVTRLVLEEIPMEPLAIVRATARGEAEVALLKAELAVRRYILANSKPPDNLVDVVPQFLGRVPLDPQDGQPLRYRVESDRVVIYSIGMDRKDDLGETDPLQPYALDMAEVIPLPK